MDPTPANTSGCLRRLRRHEPARRMFEPQWHPRPCAGQLARRATERGWQSRRIFGSCWPNDFLVKVDAASMRHGLEVRVPMLDEDLVAYGLTLPHRLRVDGRAGKRVLREVARRQLPRAVVDQPKQGFTIPVDRWAGRPSGSSFVTRCSVREPARRPPRSTRLRALGGCVLQRRAAEQESRVGGCSSGWSFRPPSICRCANDRSLATP